MRVVPLALVSLLAAACDTCTVQAERFTEFAAEDATAVRVCAGAGSLRVTGVSETGIRVRGLACAPDHESLADVDVSVRREGEVWVLTAQYPAAVSTHLDLIVEVPAAMAVEIVDGTGSVDVSGVAALKVEDGTGNIAVSAVVGDVHLRDGTGSIRVKDVGGEVRIHDGTGSVSIHRAGSVVIEADGTGSIEIRDVAGDVSVGPHGTGSLEISGVRGKVLTPKGE